MINYYDILGITPSASNHEIRDAYAFQIKVFHPDKYDPDAHPQQYSRALAMTQRLNQARDTLLDTGKRRLYDEHLSAPSGPERKSTPPPPPTPPSEQPQPASPKPRPSRKQITWALAGIIVALLLARLGHPSAPSGSHTLGANLSPAPNPCPSGTPTVTATSLAIEPDPDADDPDEHLFIITGMLLNSTTDTINSDGLGFYVDSPNPDLEPDWTDGFSNMEVSGDVTAIPPNSSVTWKEKYILDWPVGTKGPLPNKVTPVITYPYTSTSKPESHWNWTDLPDGCSSL